VFSHSSRMAISRRSARAPGTRASLSRRPAVQVNLGGGGVDREDFVGRFLALERVRDRAREPADARERRPRALPPPRPPRGTASGAAAPGESARARPPAGAVTRRRGGAGSADG
jgi:hypothetical protein